MCDYSLQHVRSRAAQVGDKLTTRNFGTGTRGFAAPEDPTTAVCILPGTELAFSGEIAFASLSSPRAEVQKARSNTAVFRQINRDLLRAHHDALEFPDGTVVLLTDRVDGPTGDGRHLPARPAPRGEWGAQ